jgi:hypothetical protein
VNSTTGAVTGFCQRKTQSDNYVRPIQGYQAINLRDYGSTSNYNSLQASVDHRFSKGLQFGAAYTWSKALTYQDTVDGAIGVYQDRRFWDYGPASFDRAQNLVFHWSANVPNVSRLTNNAILKAIGDNWQWSGIGQFTSGAPGSIAMSGTPNYTYGGDGARAFVVGRMYSPKDNLHTSGQWLNSASFAAPCANGMTAALITSSGCVQVPYTSTVVGGTTYQYWVPTPATPGLVRNTTFRVPGTNNWDMALQKDIPVKERMRFSIRAEAYNVFNHVSFDQVGDSSNAATLDYDYSTTGNGSLKSTSTFGQVAGERGPRTLQLSGRFSF